MQLARLQGPPLPPPEHPGSEEAQQGRQQGQRGQHGEGNGNRRRHRHPVEEAHAQGEHAQQGDADGDPGEQHGPPRRVERVDDRALGRQPATQSLAVAGDDEQGVVDPHAKADQRRELGAERSHVEHVGEQAIDGQAAAQRQAGRGQRQHHGQQRAEDEEEHDARGQDADGQASRLGLVGALNGLAAEGNRQSRAGRRLGHGDDALDRVDWKQVGLGVEVDRRIGDLPRGRDLGGAARAKR